MKKEQPPYFPEGEGWRRLLDEIPSDQEFTRTVESLCRHADELANKLEDKASLTEQDRAVAAQMLREWAVQAFSARPHRKRGNPRLQKKIPAVAHAKFIALRQRGLSKTAAFAAIAKLCGTSDQAAARALRSTSDNYDWLQSITEHEPTK
jgi:hypothetical protein